MTAAAVGAKEPASQEVQDCEWLTLANLPGAHDRHVDCDAASENRPGSQSVHATAPTPPDSGNEYEPAWQALHTDAPNAEVAVPAGHGLQAVA